MKASRVYRTIGYRYESVGYGKYSGKYSRYRENRNLHNTSLHFIIVWYNSTEGYDAVRATW